MMENRLLFIGAIGMFFLAVAATLVSDMHGIGDWYISSMQVNKAILNPAQIYSAPYSIAGYFGEPLLMVSISMIIAGLYGSWLKYHNKIALIAMAIGILYLLERIFWSYVTVNFARNINLFSQISDYQVLKNAGFLKGLGALFGGIIGGFGFTTALILLFLNLRNPYGIAGGVIVLLAMVIGMPAKLIFMDHVNFAVLTTFIISMVIKNFGIILFGVGFLMETITKNS